MLEMLLHTAQFLINTIILVVAILIVFAGILALASKNKNRASNRLQIKNLNEHYAELKDDLQEAILKKSQYKKLKKQRKKEKKSDKEIKQKTIFVLDFNGDIKASAVKNLREEVSALLTVATPDDQVLLRLESPGGMVHSYGLAASQLQRIHDARIPLIIAVDKVAASGGYMMACIADRILAAPFAIIGSIGVVAQIPNFNRLLKKNNIDFEQITAGAYKRTLTVFGENRDSGREKMQQEVNETHDLFKEFVAEHRPALDMQKIATGEHWFAIKAKGLGLVDELITSDDYLLKQSQHAELIHLQFTEPKKLTQKIFSGAKLSYEKFYNFIWKEQQATMNL